MEIKDQIELSKQLAGRTKSIDNMFVTIETESQALAQMQIIKELKRFVREQEKKVNEDILLYMEESDIKELIFSEDVKIIKTVKKTNRFETQYIYKALEFTQEQVDVLPKNPSFRKSAIVNNEKTAIAYSEDITDVVVLKELDKKFIK